MTQRPSQPELFVSERPVRSDYARERSYARRRMRTLVVGAVLLVGIGYAFLGHHDSSPADIPTIKAEGSYKEKPADPGGIDIPHQDVQIYNELDGKTTAAPPVEHLLPPPEEPKVTPQTVTAPVTPSAPPPVTAQPAVSPAKDDINTVMAVAKPVATTAAPAPQPAPTPVAAAPAPVLPKPIAAAAPKPVSIDQILQESKTTSVAAPAVPGAKTAGSTVIQLASSPDQAKAQAMMQDMQSKYATALGGAGLHLVRADLGARGIFYRIQSGNLTESAANQICSSVKKMNAGCILVRK